MTVDPVKINAIVANIRLSFASSNAVSVNTMGLLIVCCCSVYFKHVCPKRGNVQEEPGLNFLFALGWAVSYIFVKC